MKRPRAWALLLAVSGALLLSVAGLFVACPNAWTVYRLLRAPKPAHLRVPVQGVAARGLVDTWNAPRSGGRKHQGIDIFARRGTQVLSPVTGLVLSVGQNRLGGKVVRVLGPGGQVHYFAHLERFGLVAGGMPVPAGAVLGFVGSSGNAAGTPPHLHYGIYNLPGGAIDPYPLLAPPPRH